MATVEDDLFDAKFLSRLRLLFFKLRKRRRLTRKGAQPTPAIGVTREFKDRRHYVSGDDFRTVDWRLYARLERLFIRLFEEIQEYHVHILIDRSQSMCDPYPEKRRIALRSAVALAYLALVSQHRVSCYSVDTSVVRQLPPLKGQGQIHELLEQFRQLEFNGQTDLVSALRRFRPPRDRKGIAFLLSDLFGQAPEHSAEAIRNTVGWPAETHVIHVLDPLELRPQIEGELRLVDVETAEIRRLWLTRRDLERYREQFEQYLGEVERACLSRQIDYLRWTTDQAFEDRFLDLLSRGSALASK